MNTKQTITDSEYRIMEILWGTERKMTVSDLTGMFFSETNVTTGIHNITITDADGEVEAYSLQGASLGKFSTLKSLNESLPAGIYIVKAANGKTSKIVVK